MKIWIDADSCPTRIREIVVKASEREHIKSLFVANREVPIPSSDFSCTVRCGKEEGAADNHIIRHAGPGDLVITRDIPLAEQLVRKGIVVLNDRGTVYTEENVGERRSERDFMAGLRAQGILEQGKSRFSPREVRHFANALDRELSKLRNTPDRGD